MSNKMLNIVMRNPKIYAQTKALYAYLFATANEENIVYPIGNNLVNELNLTNKMLYQGLNVLTKFKYIEECYNKTKGNEKGYRLLDIS